MSPNHARRGRPPPLVRHRAPPYVIDITYVHDEHQDVEHHQEHGLELNPHTYASRPEGRPEPSSDLSQSRQQGVIGAGGPVIASCQMTGP